MIETGVSIREWLSLVAAVLPLLPVCIIAVRNAYRNNLYALLAVICFLHFLPSLFLLLQPPGAASTFYINALASLARCAIFFLLFRTVIGQRPLKEMLGLLFTAFLSIALTIYILKGINNTFADICLAESGVMIAAIILVLIQLLRSETIFIFDMPLFWIMTGSLGYYTMYFITETVSRFYSQPLPPITLEEKKWLLLAMEWVRYVFYIIAASIRTGTEERGRS